MPERFQCGCEMPEYTGGIFDESVDKRVVAGPCPLCRVVERINALAESMIPPASEQYLEIVPVSTVIMWLDLKRELKGYIEAADIIMEEMER
jgi:hypothetical protein